MRQRSTRPNAEAVHRAVEWVPFVASWEWQVPVSGSDASRSNLSEVQMDPLVAQVAGECTLKVPIQIHSLRPVVVVREREVTPAIELQVGGDLRRVVDDGATQFPVGADIREPLLTRWDRSAFECVGLRAEDDTASEYRVLLVLVALTIQEAEPHIERERREAQVAKMMLDELPMDAWPAITRFLIGVDLFDLARANRWGWQLFSQDVYWRERLSSDDGISDEENNHDQGTVSALQRYVRAYSFRFHGFCKDDEDAVEGSSRGSCAQVAAFYAVFVRQPTPITFDTWFCLLDGDEGCDNKKENAVHNGGVLFGAQSTAHAHYQWASYHQQLVIVSSDRTLYCSVVDDKPAIASNLGFNRWYHLALTYGNGIQRVYLDGQLVSTLMADLHNEWSRLSYAQVGTGCITAGEMNFPEPQSCGWYPFNGIIDQFRMWKREMSGEDIQALAQGQSERLLRGFQFSLRTPQLAYPPDNIVTRVRCSRPKELRAEINRGKQPRPGRLSRSMERVFSKLSFCQWSWQLFSQDGYWRERITGEEERDVTAYASGDVEQQITTALQRYMRSFAFKFQGLCKEPPADPRFRGSYVEASGFHDAIIMPRQPYTFAVWFCLLEGDGGGVGGDHNNSESAVYTGGVLFGAQSVSCKSEISPAFNRHVAVASSDRKLYCSMFDDKKPEIASNLEFNRWYHLALTYASPTQRVHLDGKMVSLLYGSLHRHWYAMGWMQVGTGFLTAASAGGGENLPKPGFNGWFPFNGLVDSFRVWTREYSREEIRSLVVRQGTESLPLEAPLYSLKRDLRRARGYTPRRVGCSRPKERVVVFPRRGYESNVTRTIDVRQWLSQWWKAYTTSDAKA